MPYLPDEERHQSHERRLDALEAGPYFCPECDAIYLSQKAAEACADADSKPDFTD